MKEVFAGTFYLVALLSPSDAASERARAITAAQPSRLVTTAWVLTELANALSKQETRGISEHVERATIASDGSDPWAK